jgi:hypothetical protein
MTRTSVVLLALAFVVLIVGLVLASSGLAATWAGSESVFWIIGGAFGVLLCAGLLFGGFGTPRRLDQGELHRPRR